MVWRRRWARVWDRVRYCSASCRRRRVTAVDQRLEDAILALLRTRRAGASLCPSEAARRVDSEAWRSRMEAARAAARRLVARGVCEITQAGRVVDPSRVRGPMRVRLAPSPSAARRPA